MASFSYQFTALRGIQAGREYYLAMCPLKLIPKIFLFDEEEIPAELRAQRVLNRARVPDIAQYLVQNPKAYVFSAITASIDGDVNFEPLADHGHARNAGVLTVPMTARFLINDGQHRRAGIEEALKVNPELGDETISVVFFLDLGLDHSQQLFADLNKHAVRPTRSIGILYDQRDAIAQLANLLSREVPLFKERTETEKTTISNRSTKLFTLSAIYQATQALLGKKKHEPIHEKEVHLAKLFWTTLGEIIPEWKLILIKEVSAAELRNHYVHSHGVTLHAIGIAGNELIKLHPTTWQQRLESLATVDWRRTNTALWEGRSMTHGRMSKANHCVTLTGNYIKSVLDIPLTPEEKSLETTIVTAKKESKS